MTLQEKAPNFFIIGAAKAGTTTLYDLLRQHPEIFLPVEKEPAFFCDEEYFKRGSDWYLRTFFRAASGEPSRGEATSRYLYFGQKVAPRIRAFSGMSAPKFIVIFRDPVGLVHSFYWNSVREGAEVEPLPEALRLEPERLLQQGHQLERRGQILYAYSGIAQYARQIRPYLEQFPAPDFMFLLTEDLADFPSLSKRLEQFLGVAHGGAGTQPIRSNDSALPRSMGLHRWLRGRSRMKELIKPFLPRRLRYRMKMAAIGSNLRPFTPPKLDPDLENALRRQFRGEVEQLQDMIGRDLSSWLPTSVPPPTPPHVALFFSNFAGGGIQRVMLNLAGGLAKAGWRVDLVLVQADGPLRVRVPKGCQIFDLRTRHASRSLRALSGYLRAQRPSALLSSQTHLNVSAVLARLLSGWRGRLLLGEHIALDQASEHAANSAERLFPLLARVLYPLSDGIILVSRGAAERFLKTTHLPRAMVKVIYNPIVDAAVDEQSRMPPDHAWYSDNSLQVILAAGRLMPQKDFQSLLRAFAVLLPESPTLRLIILGEGSERPRLELLAVELRIREHVAMPGFATNPYAHMAHAALFVLSSRWEGFANVIVEALACGTTVVATDCPSGPAEILDLGTYGELTPVGDVRALADAMRRALAQPRDPARLRARALDFSVERIVPRYMKVLQPSRNGTLALPDG